MAGCSFQTFMLEQDTSAHINQNTLPDLDLKSINIPNTIQHLKKQALHLSLNLYQESFMPRNQVLKFLQNSSICTRNQPTRLF